MIQRCLPDSIQSGYGKKQHWFLRRGHLISLVLIAVFMACFMSMAILPWEMLPLDELKMKHGGSHQRKALMTAEKQAIDTKSRKRSGLLATQPSLLKRRVHQNGQREFTYVKDYKGNSKTNFQSKMSPQAARFFTIAKAIKQKMAQRPPVKVFSTSQLAPKASGSKQLYDEKTYFAPNSNPNPGTATDTEYRFDQEHQQASSMPPPSSHYPEAIEMWSLPKDKFVCRTYRACKTMSGKTLLPRWMRKHRDILKYHCGIYEAEFTINDVDGTTSTYHTKKLINNSSRILLDYNWTSSDVFGLSPPRDHVPHFVSDLLRTLVTIEARMGVQSAQAPPMTILNPTGSSEKPFLPLNPAFELYEETANRVEEDWVRTFATLFTHPKLAFTLVPAGRMRDMSSGSNNSTEKAICYRSLLSNNANIHNGELSGIFDRRGDNAFFVTHGISRQRRKYEMTRSDTHHYPLAVTALTRQGSRALLGLPNLKQEVQDIGTSNGFDVSFREVDFSNATFKQQVDVMQNTDVLYAAHGAGNSNFVFMRPGSVVFEIFPFAYKAGPFDNLACIFSLHYTPIMSAPQDITFKSCMNSFEKNETTRRRVFKMWDEAQREERIHPGVHKLRFEREFPNKDGGCTRMCVRRQQLSFNVSHVARLAIQQASAFLRHDS